MIPPGVVCDPCNYWLGKQVDVPFVDRFDMRLTRGLEGLRGRSGNVPVTIAGRDATSRLDLELEGGNVAIYAAKTEESEEGGLDIEVRPLQRDPADVVARTIRALWKIALACAWLELRDETLDPQWDYLRHAILGAPFKGYLLQRPFTARVTRRLDVDISFTRAADPWAMVFGMGGVALAVPLKPGSRITRADARHAGWEVHSTADAAPNALHFRLVP